MEEEIKDVYVFEGIRFAISRMGLQFSSSQELKYSNDIFKEYLRVEEKRDALRVKETNA